MILEKGVINGVREAGGHDMDATTVLVIGAKELSAYLDEALGGQVNIAAAEGLKEGNEAMEKLIQTLRQVEGVDDTMIEKVLALGIVSVLDMEEVGPDPLVNSLELEQSLAQAMVATATEEARKEAAMKERASAAQAVLASELEEGEGEDKDEG